MATFIEAHLQDMAQCRTLLDDLGNDVTTILNSMDGFLNTRAEMNGQAIFANWQSQARTLFVQKVDIVIESFKSISRECKNASELLNLAINSYSQADQEAAGVLKSTAVEPVAFETFSN